MYKRGKGLYICQKGIREGYALYLSKFNFTSPTSKFEEKSNPKKIALSKKQYKEVWNCLAQELVKELVENSKILKLPFNLGTLKIRKRKMNISALHANNLLKIDWKHYRETGFKKYHLNENRDNHSYKYEWLCIKGPTGKNFYSFNPLRVNKRKLATSLLTTDKDYFE
jgi:hypothetical protein